MIRQRNALKGQFISAQKRPERAVHFSPGQRPG